MSFEMQQRKYNKSDFIEAFDRMLDNVPYNEIDVKSLCFEVVNEPSRKVFYKNFKNKQDLLKYIVETEYKNAKTISHVTYLVDSNKFVRCICNNIIIKKVAKNKSGEKDISYVVRDFTKEKINSVLSIKSHEELKSVSSITAAIISSVVMAVLTGEDSLLNKETARFLKGLDYYWEHLEVK